jgi:histone H3/H4
MRDEIMHNGLLISKNRVRFFLQRSGFRVSIDLYQALDEEIKFLLLKASKRAKKNGRSTTMAQDI